MTLFLSRRGRKTALFIAFISSISLAAGAAIRGTVLDENGAPLSKVSIRAFAQETPRERAARIMTGKLDRDPVASGQTSEDGSFKIDVTAPVVEFAATAAGRSVYSGDVAAGDDLGAIVLRTSKPQTGHVTAGGKPVSGAIVIAGPIAVRTAKDGSFEIPRGATHLSVYHPDYALTDAPFAADRAADVQLTSGVTIRGRVLQAGGRTPVAHAGVSAGYYAVAESAEDGSFVIGHASPNWRFVRATAGDAGAIATRGSAASYDLQLRNLGTIAGTVRDARTHAGVSGMRLTIFGDTGTDTTITGANGSFAFTSVAAGHHNITASHPAMQIERTGGVNVAAGERASLSFDATPLMRVSGSVVDEEKKPVAAAVVTMGRGQADSPRVAATSAKGEFAIRVPSNSGMLTFVRDGYVTAFENAGESAGKPLAVTLHRGNPIDVKVVDGDKKPIAKVLVDFSATRDDDMSRVTFACDAGRCTTGDDGAFTVRLVPGTVQVTVSGTVVTKTFPSIRIDDKTSPLTLVAERGQTVTGRVLYSDDSPAPNVIVALSAEPSIQISTVSDAAGSFRFTNSPRGPVTLFVRTIDGEITMAGSMATQTVKAPAEDVVLKMPPSGRVTGTVVDSVTHRPITDFQLAASGGGRSMRPTSYSSAEGSFTLEHVPSGRVDLTASAVGYVRGTVSSIEVIDGKTTDKVEIHLDLAGRVVGRVTSTDGQAVSGVFINVVQGSGGRAAAVADSASTDSNGEFKLESVPPGDQRVAFAKQGFLRQEKSVEAGPGKESRLDVVLDRGLELRGRVVDESGQAVPMANVIAQAPGDGGNSRSDAGGAFTISGLRDLHYSLVARKNGYVEGRIDDVDPASSAPLTLTLRRGGTITGHVSNIPAGANYVSVSMNGDRVYLSGRVDVASGTFSISGVPDGNFSIEASASVQGSGARRSGRTSIAVVNGATAPIEIAFSDGLTVQGRVTMQGQPLAGANVVFQPSTPAGTYANALVGADGSYTITGISAGNFRVVVNMRGGPTLYSEPYTVTSSTVYDIDIHAGSLRGRVTNADGGAPVANAQVSLNYLDHKPVYVSPAGTDSDGGYAFDPLVEGHWRLMVQRDGFRAESRDVTVTGATTADVQMSAGAKVTVMLVDAGDGRPVSGWVAATEPTKKLASSGATRSDGSIDLWLTPGTYLVTGSASQYFSDPVSVTAPGPDARIPMQRAGRVVVRWTRKDVTTVGLRNVPAPVAPGGVVVGTRHSPNGAFESLRPGQYVAMLLGADMKPLAEQPVNVTGGQTATVVFP